MKRPTNKSKKTRVNITLDEELFIESGKYISNLSAFFNACLRNHVTRAQYEEMKSESTDNIRYVQSNENKKSYSQEQLEELRRIAQTRWLKE